MGEESTFGGTSSETQFVGRNPYDGAKVIYYLSKRHTFGKMKMRVLDSQGNFVTSLTPGKKKGINIVGWNFTSNVPVVAKGKTITFGGMVAPRVAAGTYKIVIEKGKDTYESTVEVKYDKNSVFTLAERKKQQDVVRKLYNMTEELAFMVYQLDTYMEYGDKMVASKPHLKKSVDNLKFEMNKLKETLVITTGDNYVGSAENQLRENMGDLYSTVADYDGEPSSTQMENLTKIEGEMEVARQSFESIKGKSLKKFLGALEKMELNGPTMKSYEEFVKKD